MKIENEINLYMEADYSKKWQAWLQEIEGFSKDIKLISKKDTAYGYIKDFYFEGAANAKVYGCLFFNNVTSKRPLIVLYHGLGAITSTEGYLNIATAWINAGYSVLGMDSRLQGGKTIDKEYYEFEKYGLMAYNVLNEDKYYSKYLFQDALQLLEITDSLAEIKDRPIVVTGGSKGGELSLLAAAKSRRTNLCICDIPSGCFLPGRIKGSHGNYSSLNKLISDKPLLKDRIMKTLSYFDIIHLSDEIKVPVLSSVGSLDEVCPPRFFKYAYDRINSLKTYIEYEGYGHGGYDALHMKNKLNFVEKYLN